MRQNAFALVALMSISILSQPSVHRISKHAFAVPFDPTDLCSCLVGNDDFGGPGQSQLTGVPIASRQTLFIVASSANSADPIGAYTIDVATE